MSSLSNLKRNKKMSALENIIDKFQFLCHIQFTDLEIQKKYKVHEVRAMKSASNDTEFYIRVRIDVGHLVLPGRFHSKSIADSINQMNVEKLYMRYSGECTNQSQQHELFFEE